MKEWLYFWLLALIWGSSFLFMKIAVQELTALQVVFLRLGFASFFFAFYLLRKKGLKWPTQAQWFWLVWVGFTNTTLPFTLITWAQLHIDTGLSSLYLATVPLFSTLLAAIFLKDEPLHISAFFGLLFGFVGVVILLTLRPFHAQNPLYAQLAVVLSAVCYASCLVIIRAKLRQLNPIFIAGSTLFFGFLCMLPLPLFSFFSWPPLFQLSTKTYISVGLLGFAHTVIAYFLFYTLIEKWGTKASLVTYAMPFVAVCLGHIVFKEQITWPLIGGGAAILGGLYLIKPANKSVNRQHPNHSSIPKEGVE